MKKLTGIRENIDALLEIEESGFIQVSREEHEYLLQKQYEKRDNLMGETNVHWLCVDLNTRLNELHYVLPEIAHAMRRNLDDVDREKRDSLEELIEFTDGLAQHIRIEQYRYIDRMRKFNGLRDYGKGMKL
jgi:hypothetical protein